MSYLKVKIYFKSRLNFLLLIFFLKWCILFLIFYEFMKIVSNVSYHIILLKARSPDQKLDEHIKSLIKRSKVGLTEQMLY